MRRPAAAPTSVRAAALWIAAGLGSACASGTRVPAGERDAALTAAWIAPRCAIVDTSAATRSPLVFVDAMAATLPAADDTVAAAPAFAAATGAQCRDLPATNSATTPPAVLRRPLRAGVDLRDLLEGPPASRPPDVVVTADPATIAFAAGRATYLVEPMPWNRTYVLLASEGSAAHRVATSLASDDARAALVRDVVSAEARPAAEPRAWERDASCTVAAIRPPGAPRPVIAHVTGDATGAELAARVVALAGTGHRAQAVAADSLLPMLASGRAAAVVASLPRDLRTPCGIRANARIPAGATALVDARPHAIVRRGSGAVLLLPGDGSVRFMSRPAR